MTHCFEMDPADLQFIQSLRTRVTDCNLWEINETKIIRAKIKSYYIGAQKYRCCYCKQVFFSSNHSIWHIDHIVPRESHPAFVFEPENLSVACPDCNTIKSSKQTLVNKRRKKFPAKSSDYNIVHPIFDSYDQHIIRRKVIYIPKTDKGRKTIEMCGLLRYAVEFVDWDENPHDQRFETDVSQILSGIDDLAKDANNRIADFLQGAE